MSWTDERTAQLKELWAKGLSGSQIARELGGVTRNAVIGRINRLGLSRAPGARNRTVYTRKKRKSLKGLAKPKLSPVKSPAPAEVLLLDAHRGQCRYPVAGNGADLIVCGQIKARGAYCGFHANLCYNGTVAADTKARAKRKDSSRFVSRGVHLRAFGGG